MNNALEYLSWRGDLSFLQSPVNEVDLFLCSQLATPDFSGIVPALHKPIPLSEAAERYFEHHAVDVAVLGALQSDSVLPMLKELPNHPRFAETSLFSYALKIDRNAGEQFSAVTVGFPDGSVCVSYQGTDDTIVGWKEDFNIAVLDTVPAQQDAVEYLEKVARAVEGPIYITGHSKGGNLAVFAAAKASPKVQERIRRVVSFDGPGFRDSFFTGEGYAAVAERIETVMSQNSMVGVLLGLAGKQVIVKSHQKGPLAHDGFSWEVRGTSFVRCASLSKESRNFDRTIDAVLKSVTAEECADFVDGLFDALFATGAMTVTDLKRLKLNQVILVIYRFAAKKRLSKTISVLLDAIFHTKRLPAKPDPEALKPPAREAEIPASEEPKSASLSTFEPTPSEETEGSSRKVKKTSPKASQKPKTPIKETKAKTSVTEKTAAKPKSKPKSAPKQKTAPKPKPEPKPKSAPKTADKPQSQNKTKKQPPMLFDLFSPPKTKARKGPKKQG